MDEVKAAVMRAISQIDKLRNLQSQVSMHKENFYSLQCAFLKNIFDNIIQDETVINTEAKRLNIYLNYYLVLCVELDYKNITNCRSFDNYKSIITSIISKTYEQLKNAPDFDLVSAVKHYIYKNFKNNISLNNIAEAIHINPNYLCRLYKQETGNTIMNDITALKIDYAKKELLNSNKLISQIAFEIGINDPAYFSNFFKKNVKMSPSKFQHKFRKNKK